MKRGKRYVEAAKAIDRATLYDTADAIALVKKSAVAKFDETIEAHLRTGCDGLNGVTLLFARRAIRRLALMLRQSVSSARGRGRFQKCRHFQSRSCAPREFRSGRD